MTPEQRYVFDTTGYLHLKNALGEEELQRAQEAADRYMNTPTEDLPDGFYRVTETNPVHEKYRWAFAFDRALEHLTMHPATWPIIKELTANKPCLVGGGNLAVNTHKHPANGLHGGGTGHMKVLGVNRNGLNGPSGFGEPGTVYADFFNVFWYLSDVQDGDGGLIVVTGSHKSEFESPFETLHESEDSLPQGIVNITPNAGDAIIMPEFILHGTLKWKPRDRERRFLHLHFAPQYHMMRRDALCRNMDEATKARLAAETQELIEVAWNSHEKKISKRDIIRLI